ncbi:MAG: hypothetical protein OEY25_07130, partial [Candidatus Aminicenantes bacterium]|nr:hypothetical protein [Candidatus Aminicenantes bacterium]
MRRKTLFSLALILLVAVFFAQNLQASKKILSRNIKSKAFTESIASAPGRTLTIDRTRGDLTITGTDGNEIIVRAVVEVGDSDEEFLEEFLARTELVLEPYRQGFRLKLRSPRDEDLDKDESDFARILRQVFRSGRFRFSMSTKIDIQVPSKQSLHIENAYGDIKIRDITGNLYVANRSGEVNIQNCGGELELENSYALVEVIDFSGPVVISNSSGAVVLSNIGGKAEVRNSYKSVDFDQIGGPLTVRSHSSDVRGRDVQGDCEITTSYKEIKVS